MNMNEYEIKYKYKPKECAKTEFNLSFFLRIIELE